MDFCKAFDSIKHEILINKLSYYGIRGISLALLESYLSNRSQYVVVNNVKSGLEYIKYGVPQGSILGPILFLLYINDIVSIPGTPEIILYADDTSVFFSAHDLSTVVTTVNQWMENLSQWLTANQLALNVKKSKYIIFSSSNRPIHPTDPINFQSQILERVAEIKFLGVQFHENLRWTPHIQLIKRTVAQCIGMLNRFRAFATNPTKTSALFQYSSF